MQKRLARMVNIPDMFFHADYMHRNCPAKQQLISVDKPEHDPYNGVIAVAHSETWVQKFYFANVELTNFRPNFLNNRNKNVKLLPILVTTDDTNDTWILANKWWEKIDPLLKPRPRVADYAELLTKIATVYIPHKEATKQIQEGTLVFITKED